MGLFCFTCLDLELLTKKKDLAVLQDPESYENMRNAIGLLKLISQGESDVRNGKVRSQEDVFKDIENSLKEKLNSYGNRKRR